KKDSGVLVFFPCSIHVPSVALSFASVPLALLPSGPPSYILSSSPSPLRDRSQSHASPRSVMAEPQYRYLAPRVEQGVLVLTITHPHLRSTQFDLPDVLREEMLRAVAQAKANTVTAVTRLNAGAV